MGFLRELIKGGKSKREEEDAPPPPCPHTSLAQRWDQPEDMGKKELATYVCTSCGETFTYERAQLIMEEPLPPFQEDAEAPRVYDDESKEPTPGP